MASREPTVPYDPDLRVSLFSGKGGVGKTTLATATAVKRARADGSEDVLLFSTDPAHGVRDALGDWAEPVNLDVVEFDAKVRLEEFRESNRAILHEIVERGTFFDDRDIEGLLDLSLPGMDEVMASLELAEYCDSSEYDAIVIDCAPTGHTLRLLETPTVFKRWLGFLDAALEKHRYMRSVFGGTSTSDRYDRFLEDLDATIDSYRGLLRRPATTGGFVVADVEPASLAEAETLLDRFDRLDVPVGGVILNRWTPPSATPSDDSENGERSPVGARFTRRDVFVVPHYRDEIIGASDLTTVADDLVLWRRSSDRSSTVQSEERSSDPPSGSPASWDQSGGARRAGSEIPSADEIRVEGTLVPPTQQLLFFAGKGGVGKTLMACSTAAYLASSRQATDVLVASTDPAPSLSETFGRPVGDEVVEIGDHLSAVEIDASREYEQFRETYRDELLDFLETVEERQVDPAFDRKVMESLVDLSPPGIDEVMAMVSAVEMLRERDFDHLVFDSAPTGHFLRLLETPEILDGWLKMFFRIIRKYRRFFRLPTLSSYLVDLSKGLKSLRTELHDAASAAVHAVTEPSEMAAAELGRLVGELEAHGVAVPNIIVNKVLPPVDSSFWRARLESQWEVVEANAEAYGDASRLAVVRRVDRPQGLDDLERLGRHVYRDRPAVA